VVHPYRRGCSAPASTHIRRHGSFGRTALGEARDRALDVVGVAVLAVVAFGLEARDPELEA
jgi:hypothetical protein